MWSGINWLGMHGSRFLTTWSFSLFICFEGSTCRGRFWTNFEKKCFFEIFAKLSADIRGSVSYRPKKWAWSVQTFLLFLDTNISTDRQTSQMNNLTSVFIIFFVIEKFLVKFLVFTIFREIFIIDICLETHLS